MPAPLPTNTRGCMLRQCSARPVARLAAAEVVFEALLHAALGQAGSSTMRVPGPPVFARVPGLLRPASVPPVMLVLVGRHIRG
jgi:hypothetical protein